MFWIILVVLSRIVFDDEVFEFVCFVSDMLVISSVLFVGVFGFVVNMSSNFLSVFVKKLDNQ